MQQVGEMHLGKCIRLVGQAGSKALELGWAKGAPSNHGVPEPVVEAAEPCSSQVELARISAPLIARHLQPQRPLCHYLAAHSRAVKAVIVLLLLKSLRVSHQQATH